MKHNTDAAIWSTKQEAVNWAENTIGTDEWRVEAVETGWQIFLFSTADAVILGNFSSGTVSNRKVTLCAQE